MLTFRILYIIKWTSIYTDISPISIITPQDAKQAMISEKSTPIFIVF